MKNSATVLRKLKRNNAHVADYLDAYRRMGMQMSPSVFQKKMLAEQ